MALPAFCGLGHERGRNRNTGSALAPIAIMGRDPGLVRLTASLGAPACKGPLSYPPQADGPHGERD
jgi:hypothetical protein